MMGRSTRVRDSRREPKPAASCLPPHEISSSGWSGRARLIRMNLRQQLVRVMGAAIVLIAAYLMPTVAQAHAGHVHAAPAAVAAATLVPLPAPSRLVLIYQAPARPGIDPEALPKPPRSFA